MTVKEAEKLFQHINYKSVFNHLGLEAVEYSFCKVYSHQDISFYVYSNKSTNAIECFCPQEKDYLRPYDIFLLVDLKGDIKNEVNLIKKKDTEIQFEESVSREELLSIAYSIYPLTAEDKKYISSEEYIKSSIFKGNSEYYATPLYDENGINNILYFNKTGIKLKYDVANGVKVQKSNDEHYYIGVFPNPFVTNLFFEKYPINQWQVIFLDYRCDIYSFLRVTAIMNKRNLPIYLIPGHDKQSLIFSLRFIALWANYFSNLHCDVNCFANMAEFTIFYDRKKVKQIQFSNFFTSIAKVYRVEHGILGDEEKEYVYSRNDFISSNTHMQNGKSTYSIRVALKSDNVILFCQNFIKQFELDGNIGISLYDQEITT